MRTAPAAMAASKIHLPIAQGLQACPLSVLHALLSHGLFLQGSLLQGSFLQDSALSASLLPAWFLQLLPLSEQPQSVDLGSGLGSFLAAPAQQAGTGDCWQSALGWGLAPDSATLGQQAGVVGGQQEPASALA